MNRLGEQQAHPIAVVGEEVAAFHLAAVELQAPIARALGQLRRLGEQVFGELGPECLEGMAQGVDRRHPEPLPGGAIHMEQLQVRADQ